jgi:hypothetical protein
MKNVIFAWSVMVALVSCKGSGVKEDAQAVCDCLYKTRGSNPVEERSKCMDLHRTTGEKYLQSPEDLKKFNEIVTPCIVETVGQ